MTNKLLFIINTSDFFLSHRLEVALAAKSKNFEVHVSTFSGEGHNKIISSGFIHHNLRLNRNQLSFYNEIITFFKIFKLIFTVKPRIIHLVTIKPIIYGGLISRFLGIHSIVVAFSGLGTIFTPSKKKYTFLKLIYLNFLKLIFYKKKNLKVIFQNNDDKKIIKNLTNLKDVNIEIIKGSGVNLNIFKNLHFKNEFIVVSMISRFLKNKGVQEFINAAVPLKKEFNEIKFYLIGDIDSGNPETLSYELINKLNKNKVIEIYGYKKNIVEAINQSSIVVLPSYREGLPKILIEAAACERPVVTTNVPGCRDAIINNITGLLAEPFNSEDLTSKIKFMLENKDIMKKMGLEGRKFVKSNFSIEYVIQSHLDIYQYLIR